MVTLLDRGAVLTDGAGEAVRLPLDVEAGNGTNTVLAPSGEPLDLVEALRGLALFLGWQALAQHRSREREDAATREAIAAAEAARAPA
jgi:hypothetical protein